MTPITETHFKRLINLISKSFPLSNACSDQLKNVLFEKKYSKGNRIISTNDPEGGLWFLLKGIVKEVTVDTTINMEKTSWLWFQDDFVMGIDLGNEIFTPIIIQMLEDCELVCISKSDLITLRQSSPEAERIYQITKELAIKNRLKHFSDITHLPVKQRVQNFLRLHPHVLTHIKHKDILEFLAIKSDSLSRYL